VTDLAEQAWTDVADVARSTVLVVPLGSTEQHGPHLPLGTDTAVAVELVRRLAGSRDGVLAAPALPYGSAGEHAGFAGTLSIGGPALELVLLELARSADAFAGVAFVSAHGGNAGPLAAATHTLHREGRTVLAWSPTVAGGDAHAGRTETSMMLALRPDLVALDRARRGNTQPLRELVPALRRHGVAAVAPTGVLGDPAGASAATGTDLLEAMTCDLMRAYDRWRP
jgi:creatinine amidohydrolase